MKISKIISFSLPLDMEKEVQKIAKEERSTISELLLEALRQYLENRDLTAIRKVRAMTTKKGLSPKDVMLEVLAAQKDARRKRKKNAR